MDDVTSGTNDKMREFASGISRLHFEFEQNSETSTFYPTSKL
jgi:hypothetical protein